jgi:hypothetical protein
MRLLQQRRAPFENFFGDRSFVQMAINVQAALQVFNSKFNCHNSWQVYASACKK